MEQILHKWWTCYLGATQNNKTYLVLRVIRIRIGIVVWVTPVRFDAGVGL